MGTYEGLDNVKATVFYKAAQVCNCIAQSISNSYLVLSLLTSEIENANYSAKSKSKVLRISAI